MEVRCKLCRHNLLDKQSTELLTSHSIVKNNRMDIGCGVDDTESCSYFSIEKMPEWIENAIKQESWTKGRLYCPNCKTRVGSFNFINELRCNCDEYITPPIRITNSKVDIFFGLK